MRFCMCMCVFRVVSSLKNINYYYSDLLFTVSRDFFISIYLIKSLIFVYGINGFVLWLLILISNWDDSRPPFSFTFCVAHLQSNLYTFSWVKNNSKDIQRIGGGMMGIYNQMVNINIIRINKTIFLT